MQAQQTTAANLPMMDFAKTVTLIALEEAGFKVIMMAVAAAAAAEGEVVGATVTTDILVGFQSMWASLNTPSTY